MYVHMYVLYSDNTYNIPVIYMYTVHTVEVLSSYFFSTATNPRGPIYQINQ